VLFPALAWLVPATETRTSSATAWMLAGGLAGGLGLWVNLFVQLPVLIALFVAGVPATWRLRGELGAQAAPLWRAWGLAGTGTSLVAWLVEVVPDQLSWSLQGNHAFVALGWLGAAKALVLAAEWGTSGKPRLAAARGITALLAMAVAGWALWKSGLPWLQGREVFGTRLTSLPLSAVAANFHDWLNQGGPRLQLWAVVLPLGLLAVPCWLWFRRPTSARDRVALLIAAAPLAVALPFAWQQLRWWSVVAGLLLGVATVVTILLARETRRTALGPWLVACGLCLLPGLVVQRPLPRAQYEKALTQFEVEGLMERSLAHWLAERSGTPPVVLAPPFRTTALAFHGNLRGLGSLNLANKPALEAAARIASATTPEEAQALIARRGITHIVMPSWDGYLEEYARLFTSRPENSFAFALKKWAMPPWLLPVPYQLPAVGGFEDQVVFIFETAEEQDAATAVSRLTEYFLEMGQGPLAASAASALVNYPENLPALAALAQVEAAQGNSARYQAVLKTLVSVYRATEEHDLSWDRRVSLAVVLMQGKQADMARREMELCLALMDEARLRSLSVGSLYRFQVLLRALNLQITDPKLQSVARNLLPEALRTRLQ
jgi:hypothetical protein